MEQWVTIKTLKRRHEDWGTRRLAHTVGVSRNTVKRALAMKDEPHYQRKESPNPAIEPFKEYIYERLIVKQLRGSRVLKELRAKGYDGSQSAFYRYTATLEHTVKRTFHPYETAPGEQAQFDWSPYTILIDNIWTKVYVFIFLLGFSRYRIYQASLSQTLPSVFEAMENSIVQIGGSPDRTQTDNAKCFILDATRDYIEWNPRYLAFCGHYGFHPSRSLPRHPWSKGKVENPFDYLEDQFIAGNTFTSFEDFLRRLDTFQQEVNASEHGTTKQEPRVLFERERDALQNLPSTRYVNTKEPVRKVTADCLCSFDGCRYSVPYVFALREVWLRVSKGYLLEIYSSSNTLIATHRLSAVKGKVIIDESHYQNHRIERGNWQRLCTMFLQKYGDFQWFLDKVQAQKRVNPAYQLTQILDLVPFYDA